MEIWLILFPFLILLPFLAAIAWSSFHTFRPVRCPDCGDLMPMFYAPSTKTRRMWRAGGYLCAGCGCETDTAGRKVAADTPLPPFPTRQWAFVGVMLAASLALQLPVVWWFVAGRTAFAPLVVALPQQAPPAAPDN